MLQKVEGINITDDQGNPTGGNCTGLGIHISWQDGPLGNGPDKKEPNGAFIEGVIAAAIQRLEFFQNSKFKCRENALAITKLEEALHWLLHRSAVREAKGVQGTHNI